jgi:hypothetical protein
MSPECLRTLGEKARLSVSARIGDGDPQTLVEQYQIDRDQLVGPHPRVPNAVGDELRDDQFRIRRDAPVEV